MSLTSLTGPSLILEKGDAFRNKTALLSNQTYKLIMVAWLDDGNYAEKSYIFHTNVPPYSQSNNAECFVDPTSGEAITTKFRVECVNWTDSDLPLTYQFAYKTQFGFVAFHTGWQPNVTTELPIGNKSTNYSLDLRLEILDSLGDYSDVYLAVQVAPPRSSNIMESQGQLDNLFASGDVDRAMQMAFAMLSAAGDSDGAQSYKSSLIDKMENIVVGSVEQATLVVGVLAMATDNDDGISGDSQEKALNLLGSTVDFLSSQMSNGSMDAELVQSLGTSLFSGIGNVLGAASDEAGAESEDSEGEDEEDKDSDKDHVNTDEMKEKSKKRAQNALSLVSQVGDSLLSTKAVGEKPTVFKTKSMGVVLDRQRSSDMGGKKLGEGSNRVALPSADSLFGNDGPDAVDSQMLAFKDNPFTWDKSAKTVKSSVLDFKLKSKGGDALNISGLQEPVELFIPIASKEGSSDKDNSSAESLFFKPSNGTSNLRYHRFLVSSHEVQVAIRIRPEKGKRVDVFVNYKTKPTPHRNVFNTTIPNWSSCANFTGESPDNLNCSSDPYTFTFSSLISGHTGPHFLGIRYMKRDGEAQSKMSSKRKRRSCGLIHGRMKRSCVDVKDPPTTPPPTPMIIVPKYNSSTDVNYSLSISVSGCLYWSETKEKWTGEGCKVGPNSNSKQLHCLCTHLSAFGGDFFVAPNPIDFDKVFAAFSSLAETGNFVVLSTVCALLGLYVIGLLLARREDKRDELRVVANVCINENQGDNKYLISIQTGMWRANGTTANVGLAIHGSDGNTEDITLTDSQSEKVFFSRGSINNFTLCLPESLGSLEKIRIWHDNSGDNPSWFLTQVLIVDVVTGEKAHFVANRWIAVEKEDGKLNLELTVSGKKELSGFKNLFYSRTATSLGDKHLWLSIFTRPPHNPFTRAQRLACCISILFAAMVTNAMFYNFGTPPGDAVQIGPLKVSLTQIKIGIQSSIVAIPVNVLVVTIFRQLKAKESGNAEEDGARRRGCLPHWFVFVAWFICTMATLTSAAFIVFYSLMWGAETSNEWLVSVMVSFFQDAIVMQPLKVLLVASILSILVKKPPEQEKVMGEEVQRNAAGEVITLNKSDLEKARKFRSSLVQIGRKVVEFTLFGIFVLLMMVVCYGNRGVERFMVTESMDNLFQTFTIKVKDTPTFWKWSEKFLVPNLYEVDWYNGRSFGYKEGFLSNRAAFLVGMPRMRQLRVKAEKNCSIAKNEPSLARQFLRCVPFYTSEMESVSQYNRPGWIPVKNATLFYTEYELEKQCPKPWRYLEAADLQVRPFGGQMATFVGGGYVADLGYNFRTALKVIRVLEEDNWIDDHTMAVFIEFTIFEPSSSLFSTIKLLFERFPTGGSSAKTSIKTLSLYASSDPNSRTLFQVCQLLLMIVLIVFLFAEIGKLRREKCSYFKQMWNWLELLQISSTICSLVFFFIKESQTSKYVKKLQENPFQTSSPDNIEFMSDMETYVLSFVIFIMTIKFLRLIKFNSHVCQVLGTIQKAANNVLSFMTVFVTILLAYTQVGFLVFSSDVDAYRSFYSCLRAMLLLLFGGEMRLEELRSTSRFIAPMFIFGYLFSMAMVLLNMFLAILNDSYYEVKNVDAGETFANAELGAFMADYMKDKYNRVKDDTLELIEETIIGVINFVRGDRNSKQSDDEAPLQSPPEESQSEEAKLASLDSMYDIEGDGDEKDGASDRLVKNGSRESLSDLMCESVSLSDLKEAILQIGREMRQSVTSLTSAVSNLSLNEKTSKKAVHWLDEEGETLDFDNRTSPYFFSLGSYLEDIWQKEENRRKRTGKSRPKDRRQRRYKRRQIPTRQEIYVTNNVY
ncbi:polycystic kidney disease protein 1-like 2 [Stylophora pistillata]|nr:polycystic kidney disease protein 1-like 2 [Stylophora pistillata]